MNTPNFDKLEKDLETKQKKKEKRKKSKMKLSGGNVRKLQKIIKDKK